MPKHGFLTPKAIGNRIKAKGLQKLRWFCQMCQKQCRDANGFKCHCMSESHRRQMGVFANNPGRFLNEFSSEFQSTFIRILSHGYGTNRVHANTVYQDLIKDRNHFHMNGTVWSSLSGFVRHLGRTGRCKIDYQEDGHLPGWYIQWIEKNPEKEQRQAKMKAREEAELSAERRHMKQLEQQRATAARLEGKDVVSEATDLDRAESATVSITFGKKEEEEEYVDPYDDMNFPIDPSDLPDDPICEESPEHDSETRGSEKRKASAMEEIMWEEEAKRAKGGRKDYWLHAGIIVKVMNKKLSGGKYYKKKGTVDRVEERYGGVLTMLESGDQIQIDQSELETVIPAIGGRVMIVNGTLRGQTAVMKALYMDKYQASIEIDSGPRSGMLVNGMEYEDICKVI